MVEVRLVRRSREELQLLAVREVLRATAAALPLDEILSVIANMTIIVFDATTSWFMLAGEEGLRTVVARGEYANALAGKICRDGDSAVCRLGGAERPQTLTPRDVDPDDPVLGTFARHDEHIVLLPLRSGSRFLGLLGTAVTPEASLDTSFLVTVAEQASAAVESSILREETRTWRQRLDAVFERMAEAVLVFDRAGNLALMNASAQELFGDKLQVGGPYADMLADTGLMDSRSHPLPYGESGVYRALHGERLDNLERELPTAGGNVRHLLVSAVPLSGDHDIQGAVVVYRDITYIREMERMRAEFLSMVSHELRSPLTSILGYAQLIERQVARGEAPRELDKRLGVIIQQSKRVNLLVEDLLDASRAEAGRLALKLQRVDLAELIRNTAGESATLAPGRQFALDLPPDLPPVVADPVRIEQVLRNLLSNAIKFSPAGTEIELRVLREPDRLVVAVADHGTGIAKEDVATLFLPFHRVRQVGRREVKGIGLGLFISRSIVEAHGGDMWVQSQLGRGSTFYFSLPLVPPA